MKKEENDTRTTLRWRKKWRNEVTDLLYENTITYF